MHELLQPFYAVEIVFIRELLQKWDTKRMRKLWEEKKTFEEVFWKE